MSEPPFVYRLPVRFADTDAQGHVYFANYLTFCDEASGAYMRAIGYPWQQLVAEGVDQFYRSATCEYLGSAVYEDLLHVEARIDRIGRSSIRSVYVIRNDAGEDLARATLLAVCIDPETRRPTRVPDALRDRVRAYEGDRAEVT
jgi:acyl-CoA thioester hydrolase